MENSLRNILKKNKKCIRKITLKNRVKIIESDESRIVIKEKNNNLDYIYKYLLSRGFDYFAKKIDEDDNYIVYEYLEGIEEPNEQKACDIIHLLTLLHSKTTYYKEIDYDYYKKIYEDILSNINYLYNYYNDLMIFFDKQIYMSPSSYLIARNISLIYKMLDYCDKNIKIWYEKIENKKKVRVVNLHNNVRLDHYIHADKPCFISWDNSIKDNPIYDLLSFYKNHCLDFDFNELLYQYEKGYSLLEEERILLFILIALPDKLDLNDFEYSLCVNISKYFDYLYKTYDLINSYKKIKH